MIRVPTGSGIGAEEKRAALEEALQSEAFFRSGRLRSLLQFLCEAEVEGREGELTERVDDCGKRAGERCVQPTSSESDFAQLSASRFRDSLQLRCTRHCDQ